MRVLLLGGTGEARELAAQLTGAGIEVISSLAGRTTNARQPPGTVRTGGFGGATGLVTWLRQNPVDAVVDATHPFAAQITTNATTAAAQAGVPFLVLRRPGWIPRPGDNWHWADTASAAAELLPELGSRAFLTIGRQGLETFAAYGLRSLAATGVRTLARCVDPPDPAPSWCTLLLARGPFTLPDELALMRNHHVDILVTKDSGGPATAAKLAAAHQLNIPVVIIQRPPLPAGVEVVDSVAAAAQWVMRASHGG